MDRAANLLGALSLVIADRTDDAVVSSLRTKKRSDRGADSAGAALSAMYHFLDKPTVDQLARVVGLSQSGAVRLVDRLTRLGLVRRRPGPDGRTIQVALTPFGRRSARAVTGARAFVLDRAMTVLTAEERETLAELAGRMLAGMIRPAPGTSRWMCRMCDTGTCERDQGHCPVANAVRAAVEESGERVTDQPG